MNRKYDIVIIDSGIEKTLVDKEEGVNVLTEQNTQDSIIDEIGHGTAIYGILKLHNLNCTCFHIKIFDSDKTDIDAEVLCSALHYVYENIDCRIVNMSLGACILEKTEKLYNICQKLKEKGVILLAAFDNMESISYPAAFDNVIGVASSAECSKITDIEFYENSVVNVCGKGDLQRVRWLASKCIFTQGNSYACAHIAGMLSKTHCCNMEEALAYLRDVAKKRFVCEQNVKKTECPDFLQNRKAIIFPFNKEMHSLVRFKNLLTVDVQDIYDVRQSGRIHSSVNQLLNLNMTDDYIIKSIDCIDWDSFELLILGHTEELSCLIGNKEKVENLIINAYRKGKYIYCFDDISDICKKHLLSDKQVYYPRITTEYIQHIPHGMLYRSWIPMLGVYGTSSKQGKYTLQLILREKFLRDNYHVGQIGTEPSAYLFDMDSCFHFGYHSTTDVIRCKMIEYLNSEINRISRKDVDIIISGCQSGTVTYDFGNIKFYTCSQTEFMLATLPDVVVLCINPHDESSYIKRTIQYIESCVDCKVLALVVYPMDNNEQGRLVRLSKEDLDRISEEFSEQLNLPVYILGEENDMEILYSDIITFLHS